jgi:hypothetical protein
VSSIAISSIVFALVFGSTLVGVLLRSILPEHHLSADSKEVVRLATALIATLAALVLGLLVASTRSSYEQTSSQIGRITADVVVLDRLLDEYGPDALPLRHMLRESIAPMADSIWRGNARNAQPFRASAQGETAFFKLQELAPGNAVQRALQARAVQISTDVAQTRLLLFAQPNDAMSTPFLMVLVLWLVLIFTSFSIFARPNATIIAVLFVCVLSMSSAIFLVLEMGSPLEGVMQISSAPLRNSLGPLPPR